MKIRIKVEGQTSSGSFIQDTKASLPSAKLAVASIPVCLSLSKSLSLSCAECMRKMSEEKGLTAVL